MHDPSAPSTTSADAGTPLVVYGPTSHEYDFGAHHPLTPRRFGPGIDLLRRIGADHFVPPTEATEEQLRRIHDSAYIETVRMLSDYPDVAPMTGFDAHDNPPFYGMHEAASIVAGGSLDAMGRILRGEQRHAFHPGGGLHHAMPGHASGFCIYNDVAIAIALARDTGHRVLYVDLDVHHGDGVEAIFWNDPHVLTASFHETGLALFPGTGFVEDRGGHEAPGRAINIPLEPGTSDASWLHVVELVVPAIAAAFRPTILVTQHGSDSHVLDPLAHLRLTTAAMSAAARLLDNVAHEHTEGRWLATGGGGYDVYRVVPRVWSLVWLAQAHRDVPAETPGEWRSHWSAEAARHDQDPPPRPFLDPPELVGTEPNRFLQRNSATARTALEHTLAALKASNEA